MNRPNDKILNSWLEGELEGEELRNVEAWAENNAGDLDAEFKCDIGWDALNDEMLATMPESQEPPYPEFFNSKIQQSISDEMSHESVTVLATSSSLWQKLRLMIAPAAIAAVVAFYAGTQMKNSQTSDAPEVALEQSNVYVPHNGIVAVEFESSGATEIVLDGLSPISDELDIAAGQTSPGRSPMMANTLDEINLPLFF